MSKRERICSFHYDEANRKYGAEPYEIGDELVRCKECNAYMTDGYADGCGFCAYHQSVVQADDFCSYGERKEE